MSDWFVTNLLLAAKHQFFFCVMHHVPALRMVERYSQLYSRMCCYKLSTSFCVGFYLIKQDSICMTCTVHVDFDSGMSKYSKSNLVKVHRQAANVVQDKR